MKALVIGVLGCAVLALPVRASAGEEEAVRGRETGPTVTLKFHGSLREGLEKIADAAHLNLVLSGNLNEEADLYFDQVPAKDALRTLAKTYGLVLEENGRIWTLHRPLGVAAPAALPLLPSPAQAPTPVPPPPSANNVVVTANADESDEDGRDQKDEDSEEANDSNDASSVAQRMKEKFRQKSHHGDEDRVGQNVYVRAGETVTDASAFGGDARIDGHVTGDVVAFGGSVRLGSESEVDGDVTTFGGDITKEPGAVVHGDEATFGGNRVGNAIAKSAREATSSESVFSGVPGFLLQFAFWFTAGFLFMIFAPNRMKLIEAELTRDPLRCGLVGFAGGFAVFPLTILLIVTLVGILLIPVLWGVVVAATVAGYTALSSEIGKRLPVLQGKKKTQAAVLALGILALLVISRIPYVGVLAIVALGMVALGAVIRTHFGGLPRVGFPESMESSHFSR